MSLQFPSRSMRVKILYTFGTTSTCLARLNSVNVPIQTYEDTSFGLLELSACLDAICKSSPEIVSEQSLDYSVYTVDITEPDAPLVGHGKLSTLRYTSDVTIVGSVVQYQVPFFGLKETLEVTIRLTPIPGTSGMNNGDQRFAGLEWMEQHLSRKNSASSKTSAVQGMGHGSKRGLMDDDELNDPFQAPWPPKKVTRMVDRSSPGSYLASSPVAFTTPGAHPEEFTADEDGNSRNTPHPLQEVETNNAPTVEDEPMDPPTESSPGNSGPPTSNSSGASATVVSGTNDNTSNSKNMLTPPLTSSVRKPAAKSPTPEKKKAKRTASTRKPATKARRSNTAGSTPPKTKLPAQKPPAQAQESQPSTKHRPDFPPDTLCSNCGVTKTTSWRRARRKDGETGEEEEVLFCNPCGLYWTKWGTLRPHNLWGKEAISRKRSTANNSVLTSNIFTLKDDERKRKEKEGLKVKRIRAPAASTPASTPALPSSKSDIPQSEDVMPSSPTPRPIKLPSSPIGAVAENHNKENVPPKSLSSDADIDSLFMPPLTPKKNILHEATFLNTSPPNTNSSPNTWLSKIMDRDPETFKFLLDSSPTKVMSEDFMEMMSSDTVVESESGKQFFYMYDDDGTGKPTKKPTAANAASRSQSSTQ